VKEAFVVNGRYTKGVTFLLPKTMVCKRVRGWTSGGPSPYKYYPRVLGRLAGRAIFSGLVINWYICGDQ